MEPQFNRVYEGPRWCLLFGKFQGVERTAVIELQKILQYYVPYTLVVEAARTTPNDKECVALVGTATSNPLIADLLDSGKIPAPSGEEGYSLVLMESPWKPGARLLIIAGFDDKGTLNGVQEVTVRLFGGGSLLDGFVGPERLRHLETLKPFSIQEAPAVRNRGLWTWGYPITSYRRYLDNMMRLKMNCLTIWNDRVPLNIEGILDYAHARGIRVILGFHWGWGYKGSCDLAKPEDRQRIRENVLATYRAQYAHLAHDGIYFQTLTEHGELEHAGRSTAAWAVELVNETTRELLKEFPNLQIQFGLHSTSIRENYRDLSELDSRVTIVWEDCCYQIPYSYYPAQPVELTTDFETALEYSHRLATFRPGSEFALVPKGWMTIRWDIDFENHSSFILGEQNTLRGQERLMLRQNEWDKINAYWIESYPLAARFYREMLMVNPIITANGLVEDGGFEWAIQPSVALFAETLWNPHQSDAQILTRAMRPAYSRISAG